MPRAVKVYGVNITSTGQVEVKYAEGPTPLPAEWGGQVLSFESRDALAQSMQAAQADISTELLVLIAVAEGWTKTDPSMAAPAAMKPKEAQLDLIGGATAVRIR